MFHLLVVEDDRLDYLAIQKMIREVFPDDIRLYEQVETVDAAIALTKRERVDLVILDIHLPGKQGLTYLQYLNDHYLEMPYTIIQSAYSVFTFAQEALNAGAMAYLLKPLHYPELAEKIRVGMEYLRRRSEQSSGNKNLELELERFFANIALNRLRSLLYHHMPFEDLAPPLMKRDRFHCHIMAVRCDNSRSSEWKTILEKINGYRREAHPIHLIPICERYQVCSWVEGQKPSGETRHLADWAAFQQFLRQETRSEEAGFALGFSYGVSVESMQWRQLHEALLMASLGGSAMAAAHARADGAPSVHTMDALSILPSYYEKQIEHYRAQLESGVLQTDIIGHVLADAFSHKNWHELDQLVYCLLCLAELQEQGEKTPIQTLRRFCLRAESLLRSYERARKGAGFCLYDFLSDHLHKLFTDSRANLSFLKLIHFVEEHYQDENLSLDQVASCLGISSSYASHLFRLCMNSSFINYLTELRISRALELLSASGEKERQIKAIGQACGYADAGYFTRVFKKEVGMTPRDYLKRKMLADK